MPSSLSEQSAAAASEKKDTDAAAAAAAAADIDGSGGDAAGSDSDEDDDFARLELEIADTAAELGEDKNILLADFADEYDKLARALKSAHENEMRVENKCSKLVMDCASIKEQARSERAEQEELHASKLRLTADIEKAWKGVKTAHEKSADRRKQAATLRTRKDELEAKLEQGSGWTEEQKRAFQAHERGQRELAQELEKDQNSLKAMRQEVAILIGTVKAEEEARGVLEEANLVLASQIASKDKETAGEQARYEALTRQMDVRRNQVEEMSNRLRSTHQKVKEGSSGIEELERKLRAAKDQMEGYLERYDELFQESKSTTFALDGQAGKNDAVRTELNKIDAVAKEKVFDRGGVEREHAGVKKMITACKKRLESIEKQHERADKQRHALTEKITQVRIEREDAKRAVDIDQKAIDALHRERVVLTSDATSVADRVAKLALMCKVNTNSRKNYEVEIASFITQARTQRELIERLEVEVRKYDAESKKAHSAYFAALEQVKFSEVKCTEIQRKILDSDSRLKQQQNLYEQVRSERNLYSKQLLEAKDEIAGMKLRFRAMNHDINQMKDEITSKDHALVKEHFDHHKVEKQKTKTRNELTRVRKQIESSQQIISSQMTEIQKLGAIIQEAEEERQRQKKELSAVVGERDILTAQLVRRGEELEAVYEKIKINRTRCDQGATAYDKMSMTEADLHRTIQDLLQALGKLKTQGGELPGMKAEMYRLEREVFQERAKTKALQDEGTKPLNVHRWRKLRDGDPERYAQINKIQELQKTVRCGG
jgi:chromosome segregation ATPase